MGIDCDLALTTSKTLALAISLAAKAPAQPEPLTLGVLQRSLRGPLRERLLQQYRIMQEELEALDEELALLIEEHGGDARADAFAEFNASPALAGAIALLLEGSEPDQPPTLATLRQALARGLATSLAAHGEIDLDDEHTLLAEVEALIALHGEDTPAEWFA